MKCIKCNNEIQKDSFFCSYCGAPVENKESIKKVSLKCEQCNGMLTVDGDKAVLACPYCGNQSLIIENDAVTIERIRTSAHKEIEMEKIRSNARLHQMQNNNEEKFETKIQVEKFKKEKLAKFLIVAFFISSVLTYFYFSSGRIITGMLSLVQAACFGTAWCMGMNIIKERKRYIHVLVAILGIVLIVPTMRSCDSINKSRDVEEIKWSIIFMGDEIPEPNSKTIEIHDNEEKDLWIDVLNTSEVEYYEYIAVCKDLGYTIEMNENSIGYNAYNEEGYHLDIGYYKSKEEMSIRLKAPTEVEELSWYEHKVSAILPEPESTIGSFIVENKDTNNIVISITSKEDFTSYIAACKECGFIIDALEKTKSYSAYDTYGNKISISYNAGSKEMSIIFKYPMECTKIVWPTVGIGTLAPVPKSLSGKVGNDFDWTYSVYLENTSREEYEAYVEECIEAGFSKDLSNYGDSVRADYLKDSDIYINVSYEGFNIMYVHITGSLDGDYSSYTRNEDTRSETDMNENTNSVGAVKESEALELDATEEPDKTEVFSQKQESERTEEQDKIEEPETILVQVLEFKKAYIRKMSNYSLYMVFDEDSKKVMYFGTNDTSVMKGSYSGSFSSGVTISWDDGWNEKFVHASGSTGILTDGNGYDWDYKICDVEDAQEVLDGLK